MSFPKYAEYVDSGVEWLEASPSNWGLFLGKRLFKQRKEKAYPRDEQLAASQAFGVVPQKKMMTLTGNKVMLALGGTDTFRHVEENDFVISLRSFEGGIEHSAYTGCVSPAYTVLTSIHTIVPLFYKYLFKSRPYIAALQASTDSLRDGKSITFEQFGAIPLPNPSISEQTQIARFLDHETAKIDALIAEQKRLIKLLQEKRQAVISHAVTKGLDPNVPMKDSGVEWLGEVPAHWRLSKLKFLIERLIDTEHKTVPFDDDGDFYVARTSDIRNGKLDLNDARRTDSEGYTEWTKRGAPRKGDIIFTREAPAGEACIVPVDDKICLGQRTVLIKLNEDLLISGFTLWSIYGGLASRFIKELSQGSTVSHINMSDIPNTPILLPPLNEQVDIDRYLMSMTGKYDLLMIESERLMLRLTERRSAIISAAVTGKIDVRNWQPPADESAFDGDVRKVGLEASA